MITLDSIIKIVGGVGGLIGTGLGIYNLVVARRKEAREHQEKDNARQEQEAEWQLLAGLLEASKGGLMLRPKTGSPELRIAERLVERNVLQRFRGGYYGLPGQPIKIGLGGANTPPEHEE